jgi:hypothetical protein
MHHIGGVNGIIVEQFRRQCWYVSSGRLFFPGGILEFLAAHERVVPEVVRRLWDVVPPDLREQLTSALREAASPELRLPLWLRGFPKSMAELEADADERSKNLRAWALEFCRFLSVSESHD